LLPALGRQFEPHAHQLLFAAERAEKVARVVLTIGSTSSRSWRMTSAWSSNVTSPGSGFAPEGHLS
jgi:hypothetical protein